MAANRPGFLFRKARSELLGKHAADWRTYIVLTAPYLPDSGEVISLGDEYFLSLGAHLTHGFLLMDHAATVPLTIEKTFTACALIAFATDSPVVPMHSEDQSKYVSPDLKRVQKELRSGGLKTAKSHFDALGMATETVSHMVEIGLRKPSMPLRFIPYGNRRSTWPYLCWPNSMATWRALTAYWSATLSAAFPGRILNFWRAMEAVTTKLDREAIFKGLAGYKVKPVWTQPNSLKPERIVNSMRSLKRLAVQRRDELVATHGSDIAALNWLYWERRGKAAHADKSSLDFEGLHSIADQLKDALLFQYMARVAIEGKWA